MADGLVLVQELREIFAIDEAIADERFQRALASAGRKMRIWVGDEAYDDALSGAPPVDPTRREDLQLAEAHLTMHFAILGINTALRPTGIVKTERDATGQVTTTYHTPEEIRKLKQEFMETAESLASPYRLWIESDELLPVAVTSSCSNGGVTLECGCPVSKCSHGY